MSPQVTSSTEKFTETEQDSKAVEAVVNKQVESGWLSLLDRDGFYVAKDLISKNLLTEIAMKSEDYFRRDRERFGSDFLAEINENEVLRNAPEYDYIFIELLAASTDLDRMIVEALHQYAIIHNYNLIRLMSGERSEMLGHQWHRDVYFFGPRIRTAINVLIPLQATNHNNGSTIILRGSHSLKDFPKEESLQSDVFSSDLELGDALILDAATFHKAGTNLTDEPRTIISLKYTLSFFKQQYDFCRCLPVESYPVLVSDRLGYKVRVPESLEQFRVQTQDRRYKWPIRE